MVAHKNRWPGIEVFLPGEDFKAHADEKGHCVFECSRGGPLGGVLVVDDAEGEGGEDAVEGAEGEGQVGG